MNVVKNITHSLSFLESLISSRLSNFFQKETGISFKFPELKLENDNSRLNNFLLEHNVNIEEYIILLLALTPHVQPNLLDSAVQQFLTNGSEFPEIGGVKGSNHRGTIPTGETALFIIAGNDISKRIEAFQYFS